MTAQAVGRSRPADSHKPRQRSAAVRRRGFAAALPLLLLTTAQAAPDTLTLAEARALPVEALARRVLGLSASLVETAHVSAGVGIFANPYRLASTEFATAPRSAGFPGLCEAEIFVARFRPVGGEQGQDMKADLRSKVVALDRTTRFRSVDAGPVPTRGWDDAYGKAMDAACAKIGAALRPDGTSPFFLDLTDGQIDPRGAAAATALGVLAAAARAGTGTPFVCRTSSPGACRDLAHDLAVQAPDEVRSGPCEKAPRRRCVVARYDRGWLRWLTLAIESDPGRDVTTFDAAPVPIRAIRVDEVQAVE